MASHEVLQLLIDIFECPHVHVIPHCIWLMYLICTLGSIKKGKRLWAVAISKCKQKINNVPFSQKQVLSLLSSPLEKISLGFVLLMVHFSDEWKLLKREPEIPKLLDYISRVATKWMETRSQTGDKTTYFR